MLSKYAIVYEKRVKVKTPVSILLFSVASHCVFPATVGLFASNSQCPLVVVDHRPHRGIPPAACDIGQAAPIPP